MSCPKCGNPDFDEATGYGFRERVDGVPRRVCDNCGLPKAEREIEARAVDVARYKIEHRGVNHEEAEGLVDRATKVLALWKRPSLRARTAGFVRKAYEHARRAYWVLREQTVTQRIVQTKQILDKVGRIEVGDPKFQQDLDLTRGKIEEGAARAGRDLERGQTPGIKGDERKNLLKDAVESAELAFRQAVGYQRRQTKIDEGAERRRIAEAFEATPFEEEESEVSPTAASQPETAPTDSSRATEEKGEPLVPASTLEVEILPEPDTSQVVAAPSPTNAERTEVVLENGMRLTGSPQTVEQFTAVANGSAGGAPDESVRPPVKSVPPAQPKKRERRKKETSSE